MQVLRKTWTRILHLTYILICFEKKIIHLLVFILIILYAAELYYFYVQYHPEFSICFFDLKFMEFKAILGNRL